LSVSVSGNVTGGNVLAGAGIISTSGNITGGNVLFGSGIVSGIGNVSGNIGTFTTHAGTTVSVTGTVTAASVVGGVITGTSTSVTGTTTAASVVGGVITGSSLSVTGNITGGNVLGGANVNATTHTGTTVSVTGNITGGNVLFGSGIVSGTGNITGGYFFGNGSQLTGITGGGGGTPGGSNTYVQFNDGGAFGGNINFTYDKTTNIVTAGTFAGTLNGSGQNFKVGDDAWIGDINVADTIGLKGQQNSANCYIVFGNSDSTGKLGRAGTGPLTYAGAFSATGNITGGNILGGANVNATTHTGTTVSVTGTVTAASVVGGVMSGSSLTVSTGNITGGNIVNANGNGIGNIGSSTVYFNTVFAKATSAQYADVAEKYIADKDYPIGTVLRIGGMCEVSQTNSYHGTNIIGTVSDKPAYVMNSGLKANHVAVVALLGRVPCCVIGAIGKGDLLVSSEIHGVATVLDPDLWVPGCVIGKALEDYNSDQIGVIEIVVGRS